MKEEMEQKFTFGPYDGSLKLELVRCSKMLVRWIQVWKYVKGALLRPRCSVNFKFNACSEENLY